MIKPKKKCICKKCEDCNFYESWDMENKNGVRKQIKECLFYILAQEIPLIRGAMDGLQGGVNEARNRSIEAKDVTLRYAEASGKVLDKMGSDFVNVLQNIERKMIGN